MNKVMFKYPVPRRSTKFSIMLPTGWQFRRVHFQREDLQMWAEVNPDAVPVKCDFELFGTGHPIPVHAKWLATYDDGPFVMHLFHMNP